jgi:hypothetical protein
MSLTLGRFVEFPRYSRLGLQDQVTSKWLENNFDILFKNEYNVNVEFWEIALFIGLRHEPNELRRIGRIESFQNSFALYQHIDIVFETSSYECLHFIV